MQVTETSADGLRRELKVVVGAEELEQRLVARLDELKDRVKLKGFRPGRVPRAHLRKIYGRSVMAEIVQQAVAETSQAAITDRQERAAKSELRPLPLGLVLIVIFGAAGWYISRNFPTEHLARQIRAAVKSENVVRVLPVSPYSQPFSKPVYGGGMFVFVRPETPRHEMRDILRTAREMMKEADLRMRWILLVYATQDKVGSQNWNSNRREWSEEHWSWPEK